MNFPVTDQSKKGRNFRYVSNLMDLEEGFSPLVNKFQNVFMKSILIAKTVVFGNKLIN